MAKKQSPIITFLSLVAGITICLGLFLLTISGLNLRKEFRKTFGQPDPSIGKLRAIYLSISLLLHTDDLTQPVNPNGGPQTFSIQPDEPIQQITEQLVDAGIIKNASAFRDFLQYRGLDKTLQAGDHELSPAMNPIQISTQLQDATPDKVTFNILPGWRLEEVAAAIPTSGLESSPENFLEATSHLPNRYMLSYQASSTSSYEGFLLPDSYNLKRNLSIDQILAIMLQNFDNHISNPMRMGFETQGLSIYQATILASIVQKEAILSEEMPLIASVYLNRLAIGMKLDADPTVQYAVGYNKNKNTWWKVPLQPADLEIDSPYNTYKYPGLPPGPIANPGLEALWAIANPAKTSYYYFRASCGGDGSHTFAQNYQQHIENACP
jgi:UPF0755 protein